MKTLYLLRHGEASLCASNGDDFERELSPYGEQQAIAIGQYLQQQKMTIDLLLYSAARRTTTTAMLIKKIMGHAIANTQAEAKIYQADLINLLELLRTLEPALNSVLLVGHNPTISWLLNYITGQTLDSMSPCTCYGMELMINDWAEISAGQGKIILTTIPEEVL